jgi:hypothetical protein
MFQAFELEVKNKSHSFSSKCKRLNWFLKCLEDGTYFSPTPYLHHFTTALFIFQMMNKRTSIKYDREISLAENGEKIYNAAPIIFS